MALNDPWLRFKCAVIAIMTLCGAGNAVAGAPPTTPAQDPKVAPNTIVFPVGAFPVDAPLKIATWNLNWLTTREEGDPALPRDVHVRKPADFQALAKYAAKLDADIVAFQEVDGKAAAVKLFPPDRYELVIADGVAIQKTGFAIRRGLAFTRYPDLAALDLAPYARHPLRNGVEIGVTVGGQALRLLDVHLKTGCWEQKLSASTSSCRTLSRQVALLGDWARGQKGAFILLGDFNRREDRDQAIEAAASPVSLLRADRGFISPCWGGESFIDHLFLGGATQNWLVPNSLRVMIYPGADDSMRDRLSDHCAVSVRILPAPEHSP